MTHLAYVGIGANLGDPLAQVRGAIATLRAQRSSSLYRTEPQGVSAQPWYVNAVVEIRTEEEPGELFRRLQALESEAGRPRRRPRGSARILDLDLLLYDDRIIDSGPLLVPHPELHRRRFVLEPLVELAPMVCDPRDGRTAQELLRGLDDSLKVERLFDTHAFLDRRMRP